MFILEYKLGAKTFIFSPFYSKSKASFSVILWIFDSRLLIPLSGIKSYPTYPKMYSTCSYWIQYSTVGRQIKDLITIQTVGYSCMYITKL